MMPGWIVVSGDPSLVSTGSWTVSTDLDHGGPGIPVATRSGAVLVTWRGSQGSLQWEAVARLVVPIQPQRTTRIRLPHGIVELARKVPLDGR